MFYVRCIYVMPLRSSERDTHIGPGTLVPTPPFSLCMLYVCGTCAIAYTLGLDQGRLTIYTPLAYA